MKKYSSIIILMLLSCSVFSQEIVKNKEYYLTKSRKQNTGAKVMLIGGAVLVGGGLLIGDRKESSFDDAMTGGIVALFGGALMLGSIPVFLGSAKNKRKAASLAFKNVPVQQIKNSSLAYRPMAAVSLQINL
jgi:Na+/proline symporter